MELIGKVVTKSLKDVAKGKDAESHPVGQITVKLDSVEGLSGSCVIPVPVEELNEYDLGDTVDLSLVFKQTKLPLRKGTSRGATAN